jgi:hypothetical protein
MAVITWRADGTAVPRLLEWGTLVLLLSAGAILVTWPQVRVLASGVNDHGGPLLNAWALAWVARTLPTDPAHLFDANIFHPEPNTLAFSEPLILPAVLVAPVWWATGNAVLCHNLTLLSGYVLSGLAVYALVRRLTRNRRAALVASLAFGLSPVRADLVPRVQLQLTYFMPLALLALERWRAVPSPGRASLVGVLAGLQALTCVYYGVYFGLMLAVIAGVSVAVPLARGRLGGRALGTGAVAAVLAFAVVVAVLVPRYLQAHRQVGERPLGEIARSGAQPSDYLRAHPLNALHGDPAHPGLGEHRLFAGYTASALAAVGLFGPGSVPYVAGTVFAFDASRGFDGLTYAWLYDLVPALRGLRVPARFGVLVALGVSVLAGCGAARILVHASPRVGLLLTGCALTAIVMESWNLPRPLSPVPTAPTGAYAWLAGQPPSVVLEFPIADTRGRVGPQDPTFMHASTWHWHRLLNGYSGFLPAAYLDLVTRVRDLPADGAVGAIAERGADLLLVHEAFYLTGDYRADVSALDRSPGLAFVAAFTNADRTESRVYRFRRP